MIVVTSISLRKRQIADLARARQPRLERLQILYA